MPAFSEDQINEAKERVRRMHARAGAYLPREAAPPEKEPKRPQPQAPPPAPTGNTGDAESATQDDTAVILTLILLLGHEGADRALLLALLYLLF